MEKPFLELVDVHKTHTNHVTALRGVDLRLDHGEALCIYGSSGSGKTTLLAILGGVQEPTRGYVLNAGEPLRTDERLRFRERTSTFIFRTSHLNENLSVRDNIEVGFTSEEAIDEVILTELLQATGLQDKGNKYPQDLSNLDRHLVVLVRSLMSGRELLLADEPTGELTSAASDEYLKLLLKLCRRYQKTLVIGTHNADIAAKFERTVFLVDGRVSKEVLVEDSMRFELNLLAMSKLAEALLNKSNADELKALGLAKPGDAGVELTKEGEALAKLVTKWRKV